MLIAICKYVNMGIVLVLAMYFFMIPGGIVVYDLLDPNIQDEGIPRAAVRLHQRLTPKYERWARDRIASGNASDMSIEDISGTEWPLFGSVFYLWATESLQEAWEKDNSIMHQAPKEYARGAIESATKLVIDPNHAGWVKKHWGEEYLHRENVFYRMLFIAAITTYTRLTEDEQYLRLLREQVESLSKELDDSKHGLLDDYPDECYPTDILVAIACIQSADILLGDDHSIFIRRAIRAFQGRHLDERGIPPYMANSINGNALNTSRGCSNSYMCLFAPVIWPKEAERWYTLYEKFFWQYRWSFAGFREFPKDVPGYDWYMDVDSGPVLAGHGISASAFGAGAARVNGRFDHAYPLTAELIATCWPLPDGTLAGPRILSNAVDAPYLGEASILFILTRQPARAVKITKGGSLPTFVYLLLAGYFGIGTIMIFSTTRDIKRWRNMQKPSAPYARTQFVIWSILAFVGVIIVIFINVIVGLAILICTQILPRGINDCLQERK